MLNATPNHIVELVVYTVKPDKQRIFLLLRELVKNKLSQMKGFISYSTYQSNKEKDRFMDFVVWSTIENATKAASQFQNDLTLKPFMDSFEQIILFEHFLPFPLK